MGNKVEITLPVSCLKVDYVPAGPQVLEMVASYRCGVTMKPLKVQLKDGRYIVKDGRHRLLAAKLMGWKSVPVTIAARYRMVVKIKNSPMMEKRFFYYEQALREVGKFIAQSTLRWDRKLTETSETWTWGPWAVEILWREGS